jgi:hypothetical protein
MRKIALLGAVLLAALSVGQAGAVPAHGDKFVAHMTGDQETPHKGDPDGRGRADIAVDTTRGDLCYEITYDKINHPDKGHIHRGTAGQSGPVVVDMDPKKGAQCVKPSEALMEEIKSNPSGFYVNLHSPDYPNGSIRGQVERVR